MRDSPRQVTPLPPGGGGSGWGGRHAALVVSGALNRAFSWRPPSLTLPPQRKRKRFLWGGGNLRLVFAALLLSSSLAFAVQPDEVLPDPAKEARARELSSELRCLVCQNQSIDDSDASLAKDIRVLIRERISKGESNDQVRDFLVSRYGDFILLKPPLKLETLLLWLSAPLTLLLGGLAVFLATRRGSAPTPALSAEEEKRLAEIEGRQSGRPAAL